MQALDRDIARRHAVAGIEACVRRLKWLAAATRFEFALRRHALALKYGFNPDQPRVPAGDPAGGQWTGSAGDPSAPRRIRLAGEIPTGDWPEIPKNRPLTSAERTAVLKRVARRLGPFMTIGELLYHGGSWIYEYQAKIYSYRDPPRTLQELQDAVTKHSTAGYHDHHIVEQTQARRDGYSEKMINGRDNVVRVPAMRHEDINGWYMRANRDYGGQSPREYLRDKSWDERRSVGLRALIDAQVLKP